MVLFSPTDPESLKKRYELILTSIGEGVYGLSKDGKTTFVNPAAERMTGWSEGDLLGKVVHEFHHHSHEDGSHYPVHECAVYQTVQDGKAREVANEVFWRKDGSNFPVEYIATAIELEGEIVGAVIVFKDISERRSADHALKTALLQVERLKEQLQAENRYLMDEIRSEHNFVTMVGNGAALRETITQIGHVAPTDTSVLILGESGTGKELIARSIHESSLRKTRPLVKVNCGAIASNLVESELFGHEKGAFTGAHQTRIGRFELADGGTLFLDEIGELPHDIQAKLLRVLQEGEFERLGSNTTLKVDVRVIAATNRDLKKMVDDGLFRGDLYYRLNVFPVSAKSLRDRKEDIPALVEHTLLRLNKRLGKNFTHLSPESLLKLMSYHWPGNVRELQNLVERAAIVGTPPELVIEDLPSSIDAISSTTNESLCTLREAEKCHIEKTLASVNGILQVKWAPQRR